MTAHARHQLYGPGGLDRDHPSLNVIEEIVQEVEGGPLRVMHYDAQGAVLEDRLLTEEEVSFFFPTQAEHAPDPADVAFVCALTEARLNGEA